MWSRAAKWNETWFHFENSQLYYVLPEEFDLIFDFLDRGALSRVYQLWHKESVAATLTGHIISRFSALSKTWVLLFLTECYQEIWRSDHRSRSEAAGNLHWRALSCAYFSLLTVICRLMCSDWVASDDSVRLRVAPKQARGTIRSLVLRVIAERKMWLGGGASPGIRSVAAVAPMSAREWVLDRDSPWLGLGSSDASNPQAGPLFQVHPAQGLIRDFDLKLPGYTRLPVPRTRPGSDASNSVESESSHGSCLGRVGAASWPRAGPQCCLIVLVVWRGMLFPNSCGY